MGAGAAQGMRVSPPPVEPDPPHAIHQPPKEEVFLMLLGNQPGDILPFYQAVDKGNLDNTQMVCGKDVAAFERQVFRTYHLHPGQEAEQEAENPTKNGANFWPRQGLISWVNCIFPF